jgi:hypothetical protein
VIVYHGGRLGMQQLVDQWIKEERAAAAGSIAFKGEVRDMPSGLVLVSAMVTEGSVTRSVSRELAEWLRSKGLTAQP